MRVVAHDDGCCQDGHDAAESERFGKQVGQVAQNDHHGVFKYREHEDTAVPARKK